VICCLEGWHTIAPTGPLSGLSAAAPRTGSRRSTRRSASAPKSWPRA